MASRTLPLFRLFRLISVYDLLGRSLEVLVLFRFCIRDLGFLFATTGPYPFSLRGRDGHFFVP